MINSAALPNVALRNPPHAGPERRARSSVASPIIPASGMRETAAVRKIQGEPGSALRRIQHAGAARSRMFERLSTRALSTLVAERFEVFSVRSWQQVEEG